MKKVSLSILGLIMGIAVLQAQDKTDVPQQHNAPFHKHHHKGGPRGHYMDFKKLNLSQDQQSQMKKINGDFRQKIADLKKQEATITVKDYKTQMKELGKQRHQQIQNVLTKEQKDQLAQMRADKKKEFDKIAKNRMEKMKAELQLSNDQTAKMDALRADAKQKIKAIREDKSLTDEQKKQQVIAVFKKQHNDMNSILTPEQVKKMEDMHPRRMHNDAK
ncbi:MAG: hypothetical protein QM802_15255 [Agriterribacter sp.]